MPCGTPGGGRITLAVQIAEQVELKVIDGGSGIEPEDLPYVFDRFFRADKARGANSGKMGLGWRSVKPLLQRKGGTILAEIGRKGSRDYHRHQVSFFIKSVNSDLYKKQHYSVHSRYIGIHPVTSA